MTRKVWNDTAGQLEKRPPTIGLVACSKSKLDRAAPARELYTSPLFKMSLSYLQARCGFVYVLSAHHGLVELEQPIKPYDSVLTSRSKAERTAWARRIVGTLVDRHGRGFMATAMAGDVYTAPLRTAIVSYDPMRRGAWQPVGKLVEPLHAMQVGQRLSFLKAQLQEAA
jgi:hypothetical protein